MNIDVGEMGHHTEAKNKQKGNVFVTQILKNIEEYARIIVSAKVK
jgi:hypothetical protein